MLTYNSRSYHSYFCRVLLNRRYLSTVFRHAHVGQHPAGQGEEVDQGGETLCCGAALIRRFASLLGLYQYYVACTSCTSSFLSVTTSIPHYWDVYCNYYLPLPWFGSHLSTISHLSTRYVVARFVLGRQRVARLFWDHWEARLWCVCGSKPTNTRNMPPLYLR